MASLLASSDCLAQKSTDIQLEIQNSHSTASLRGLSVVDGKTAWASGSGGTVLRTDDAGKSWKTVSIVAEPKLDFRDVHAFDANRAIVIGAGSPAKVYRTEDAGKSWKLCYHNDDAAIFFDAMDFWDEKRGIAFSDPIGGRLYLIRTSNGGRSWQALTEEQRPVTLKGEGGYAGSGTCLIVRDKKEAWVALGGNTGKQTARLMRSSDSGNSWEAVDTTIRTGESSAAFSLVFSDRQHGVVVGGDYKAETDSQGVVSVTLDGGKTWQTPGGNPPSGFRSAVALWNQPSPVVVAAGPSGVDMSDNHGHDWSPVTTEGFHTIAFTSDGTCGWSTGAAGKIGRWTIKAASE